MPIHCPIQIRNLTQDEFDERDRMVMRCAYASQNELGRLCDERVYENDLALRLAEKRCSDVHTQVPVTVAHGTFEKLYRLDLVVDHGIYELKTVSDLVPSHDAQALHYAMLLNVNHSKLINFRSHKVQGRLRFNAMTSEGRRKLHWEFVDWKELSSQCQLLHERLRNALEDWGGFLDTRLYEEALVYFCGGEGKTLQRVSVQRNGTELGSHSWNCHEDGLAFVVTALPDSSGHRLHLERLLALTQLRGIQWFNLNRATVQCVTLTKS